MTELVQCISCIHWRPRDTDRQMVRLGFAICEVHSRNKATTFGASFRRVCRHFKPAEPDIVAARQQFEERS